MAFESMYQMEIDNGRMMFPLFKTVSSYKKVEEAVRRCGIATKMIVVQPNNVERYVEYCKSSTEPEAKSDLRNIIDFSLIKGIEVIDLDINDKIKEKT